MLKFLLPLTNAAIIATTLGMATLAATPAQAAPSREIYRCVFTEPGVSVVFSERTKVMTITSQNYSITKPDGSVVFPPFKQNATARTARDRSVRITDSNGVLRYTLKLTNTGSDGASDAVYPYEVVSDTGLFSQDGQIGACWSTSRPRLSLP